MLWLLACSTPPPTEHIAPWSATVGAPWAAWDLPVGSGQVVYSDATVLSIRYDADEIATLARDWRTAVRAAGGVEQTDISEGGLWSVSYDLAPHVLALSVAPFGGATVVVVSLDGAAP